MLQSAHSLDALDDGVPRPADGFSWKPNAAELLSLGVMLSIGAATAIYLNSQSQSESLLAPVIVAGVMVTNLVAAMVFIVLMGSRLARSRAQRSMTGGNGRLHVRLVALFSVLAAVPTVLVAIFASFLFQQGVDFWFSDKSRGMFENAAGLAQGFYEENQREVGANAVAMASDLRATLARTRVDDPAFSDYYLQQVVVRNLNGSANVEIGKDGVARTPAMVDPDGRSGADWLSPEALVRLEAGEEVVVFTRNDRVEAATLLSAEPRVYLYVSRDSQVLGQGLFERARAVLADYNALLGQSRRLQLQFNLALYLGSLLVVALAVASAILVADRIVRPLGNLVGAARTAAEGDLSVRVPPSPRQDEIAVLAQAFNAMTAKLQAQTGDLIEANDLLQRRRAFMETVLSGVSAGILSVNGAGDILLANAAATRLLVVPEDGLVGQSLARVSPELAALCSARRGEAVLNMVRSDQEVMTVAAKVEVLNDGHVISFEDITQQLIDQRRAAWADVARRIAHEIKNPLTPIQLAAERLQRRFGQRAEADEGVFRQLTDTIIRQVNDVRRMVDEFSSFARMPAPTFGTEDLVDIVRRSIFLFEVAHPDVRFSFRSDEPGVALHCDRRLLSQAVANVVKNAVEAIVERPARDDGPTPSGPLGQIAVAIEWRAASGDRPDAWAICVDDDGIGLPKQREAIIEPYMTTRKGGTGLGLAIVKKIIEDHRGEIEFADSPLGGARVVITLYPDRLHAIEDGPAAPDTAGPDASVPGRVRNHLNETEHGA